MSYYYPDQEERDKRLDEIWEHLKKDPEFMSGKRGPLADVFEEAHKITAKKFARMDEMLKFLVDEEFFKKKEDKEPYDGFYGE